MTTLPLIILPEKTRIINLPNNSTATGAARLYWAVLPHISFIEEGIVDGSRIVLD